MQLKHEHLFGKTLCISTDKCKKQSGTFSLESVKHIIQVLNIACLAWSQTVGNTGSITTAN
jgi:hypothetical protein